jgi:hypothetical protein
MVRLRQQPSIRIRQMEGHPERVELAVTGTEPAHSVRQPLARRSHLTTREFAAGQMCCNAVHPSLPAVPADQVVAVAELPARRNMAAVAAVVAVVVVWCGSAHE